MPSLPSPTAARRSGAAGALLAAAALALSGCGTGIAATTNAAYQPGEGAIATVGDVAVRNLVLVADGKGSGRAHRLDRDAPARHRRRRRTTNPPGDLFEAAEGEGGARRLRRAPCCSRP